MDYKQKLKSPKWQKKRLKILERDNWMCTRCCSTEDTLHIHHKYYSKGLDPWEYEDRALVTLCKGCHEKELGRAGVEKNLLRTLKETGWLTEDLALLAEALSELYHNCSMPLVFDRDVSVICDTIGNSRAMSVATSVAMLMWSFGAELKRAEAFRVACCENCAENNQNKNGQRVDKNTP